MTLTIVPRAAIGLPEPPSTRPKLRRGIGELLVHYTGVNGYKADPLADLRYAKSVAYFGLNRDPAIPYEYSYLIGPGGGVFEQAGDYRPAHCLNWNTDSYGVLFMLGIGVAPTAAMIASFHALVAHLVATGQLAKDFRRYPHYARRATGCCGVTLADPPHGVRLDSPTGQGSLGELIPSVKAPLHDTPKPPAPTPTPPDPTTPPAEDDVIYQGLCKHENHDAVYALYSNGTKVWIRPGSGPVFRYLKQQAGESTEMNIYGDAVMGALGAIVGDIPEGVDAWGVPVMVPA